MSHKSSCMPYIKIFAECFFLFLIGVSPFIVLSKGIYISYGDYNSQIIPFWNHIYDLYHDGLPAWDWTSDMGMNTWGSYTFYGMTSPYTLISLIFPKSFLPYAMTIINAVKFGVAGLSAYIYTRQYVGSDRSAHICGVLYAFSGVQLFNMVFHFSDVISLFPLLLYSFDRLAVGQKRGMFAVMLAITGFTNYYFFFGICVFLLIYFAVKILCRELVINKRLFACIAFETVIGAAMAAVVLIPSFLALTGNKRAGASIFDISFLSYEESGTIWKILYSIFFPPDLCNSPGLFSNVQLDIASVSLYIPFFSAAGVFAVMKREPGKWYSRLCIVSLIIACIPVLNSAFSAFNSRYYARWFFMPLLIMIMMTGKFADDFKEIELKKTLKLIVCIMTGFLLLGLNMLIRSADYLIVVFGIAFLSVLFLYRIHSEKQTDHIKRLKRAVNVFSVIPFIWAAVHLSLTSYWEHADNVVAYDYNDFQPIEIDDDSFFRTLSEHIGRNAPLYFNYPTVSSFHSLISGSTSDFYAAVEIPRLQNPVFDEKANAVYSFLSVKYELYYNHPLFGGVEVEPEDVLYNRMFYIQKMVCNRYIVYENQNYIPMGFTYDNYININDLTAVDPEQDSLFGSETKADLETKIFDQEESYRREKLLLKAIWLTDEQIEKYGDILTGLPLELMEDTSDETYVKDCEERKRTAAYEFSPDETGFTSRIRLEKDNLVFYSVPYDDGFTAYVDGGRVEIEKVFAGLCAVKVPAGDHTIRFEYAAPGLKAGAAVSFISAGLLIAYCILCAVIVGKKRSVRS